MYRKASMATVWSVALNIAIIVGMGAAQISYAQDSEGGATGLRPRTDRHAENDLQRNLEFLQDQAQLKAKAERARLEQESHRSRAAVSSSGISDSQVKQASVKQASASRANPHRSEGYQPPSPPTYRGGGGASHASNSRVVIPAEFAWLPKSPKVDRTDVEAMQRPTLRAAEEDVKQASGNVEETTYQTRMANYQDANIAPVLPFNSSPFGTSTPPVGITTQPVMPPSGSSITPPPSGLNGTTPPGFGSVMPNSGTSPTVVPNVANPSNLPQYPKPTQRPAFVNSEPFVTGPPCEFDAFNMVEPAAHVGSAYPVCGGPAIVPGAPPPSSTGQAIVPPTVMPNQAPAMYSQNNAGMRPLISLGQENYNVQVGRGIIGQPTAYVPGQPFRNFFRYIMP